MDWISSASDRKKADWRVRCDVWVATPELSDFIDERNTTTKTFTASTTFDLSHYCSRNCHLLLNFRFDILCDEKNFLLFQRALIKKLPAKFTFLFYLESNLSSFKKLDKQGNKSKALTVTSDLWIFTSTLKDKRRSVSLIAVREILFRGLNVARAVLDAL